MKGTTTSGAMAFRAPNTVEADVLARLDVHPAPGGERTGYLLDVQANWLEHFTIRSRVPLIPRARAPKPIHDLNPAFEIHGQQHVRTMQFIVTASASELREPAASLHEYYDEVRNALNCLVGTS